MYYKISFNAWLNLTRAKNNIHVQDKQAEKESQVWIEVEEIVEYTSDEDSEDDAPKEHHDVFGNQVSPHSGGAKAGIRKMKTRTTKSGKDGLQRSKTKNGARRSPNITKEMKE